MQNSLEKIKLITNRAYMGRFIQTLDHPVICEVGVRDAGNFKNMLTSNVAMAIGVDIWADTDKAGQNDNLYDQKLLTSQYRDVFSKYLNDPRVKLLREFSKEACSFFKDETFDFIYIDADHTYEAVSEDLNAWFPKVKKGGVISGHDHISGERTLQLGHSVKFGVVEAVADFRKQHKLSPSNFHLTHEDYASYFIVRE